VLDAVTAAMPMDAWVRRFEWNGRTVHLVGARKSSQDILARLEASPFLKNARSQSSGEHPDASGYQPFEMTAEREFPPLKVAALEAPPHVSGAGPRIAPLQPRRAFQAAPSAGVPRNAGRLPADQVFRTITRQPGLRPPHAIRVAPPPKAILEMRQRQHQQQAPADNHSSANDDDDGGSNR